MKPFFFSYKSITITWPMLLIIISVLISYLIVKLFLNEKDGDKGKIEDIFMWLLVTGFVGARLGYVLININLYKDNMTAIFKISYYNLSLVGGIVSGLLLLIIISKKYNIKFEKLLETFTVPFYFSMSIGVWIPIFDRTLIASNHIRNSQSGALNLSTLFLLAMILELTLFKKLNNKYLRLLTLTLVIFIYKMKSF
ncbi:prolipoprotein diacylglyceryl transferase Lgt [Gottschalkia acidurici 9a]|uniref:Prolipoprotein diacylglyceryl transferase Lgt n=1 Tax=Gottschalkia acidurici (strain ATCC 7906 / DSM 604 / BCRC 14475 / CIP 104303 / KCTC 5404 / NCIMB 10678 / 9a) TaxID=1128398 RepID=K0B598_GOTA9|nr:prolipoprotein diacylglyceryl transferase family protein [Gottschalkia acidurici]AFS79716.1 prolipoprotein diacylglyceryl transferase Lgt [Gottschalkia acidurici 9a]